MELREIEVRSGAVLPPEETARSLPMHFGSTKEESAAASAAAALFDFSDRALIELAGADRVRFIHSFCTNDVKRLRAGQGCEAFVTSVKGKVVGHVWIDVAESSLWLDADAGSAERLVPHLERYIINEDVTIADRTAEWGELLAVGPQAASRLARLGMDVASLSNLDHILLEVSGTDLRIRRFDVGAHRGYTIRARRNQLADCWERLQKADIRPAGSEVWAALRIEAGLPIFGVDIGEDNLAQEVARTKTAISFTKGCYLGQEPIARIDAIGHVNRELRSLRLVGGSVPQVQSRVFSDAAGSLPVGTVTSSAFSFTSHSPVAMAVLRSNASSCGTQVFVEGDGIVSAATVFWPPDL